MPARVPCSLVVYLVPAVFGLTACNFQLTHSKNSTPAKSVNLSSAVSDRALSGGGGAGPSVPYFNTVWLEPMSLFGRLGSISSQDLSNAVDILVQDFHARRLVIAYSEYEIQSGGQQIGAFFYNPWTLYSWTTWWNPQSIFVSSGWGTDRVPMVSDGGNFLDVVMRAAEGNRAKGYDVKVVVGLSRIDDINLLNDLVGRYFGWNQISWDVLNARLSTNLYYGQTMAHDIYNQWGKSAAFDGWYLTHEIPAKWLAYGMNYYAPMGQYLKALDPSKTVIISPDMGDNSPLGSAYESVVATYNSVVNEYMYQDGLGAGYLSADGNLYYNDAARYQQLYYLESGRLSELQGIHARTGTRFIMNTEAWRMDGYNCPNGAAGGDLYHPEYRYGCNYPGSWDMVKYQLQAYSYYTTDVMLNEGLQQLALAGSPGQYNPSATNSTSYADPTMRQKASDFSSAYWNYLNGK